MFPLRANLATFGYRIIAFPDDSKNPTIWYYSKRRLKFAGFTPTKGMALKGQILGGSRGRAKDEKSEC